MTYAAAAAQTTAGLQKWVFNDGNWSLAYPWRGHLCRGLATEPKLLRQGRATFDARLTISRRVGIVRKSYSAELRRIGATVHAFAAIGAALRLHQAKQQADPAIQSRLLAAVEAVLPGALNGLNPQQVSEALAYVTFQIGEATDLFHNAGRPPGWVLQDPAVLQSLGHASRQNIRSIIALAADRPRAG